MLKAGIIGLGVGEAHIAGYRSHPECEVVMAADFSEKKLAEVRSKYSGIKFTASADEILNNPDISVVSVATYDNFHAQQIVTALDNGKHVFVEKPLCLYKKEAREIRAALKRNPGLKISSNLILRRAPRFINLKERIASGAMGTLYHVEGDYTYGRLHKLLEGWRGEMDYYSVISGGGIHLIDLILWLSGDAVTEVAAFGNRICTTGTAFRHNDMVVSILKFKSGMVGKISANFGCVHPHFHPVTVFGTKATFVNGRKDALLYETRDPAVSPKILNDEYPGAQKGDLLAKFIDSIIKDTEPEVGVTDIFNCLSVCFAIEESAQHGKIVPVEYI